MKTLSLLLALSISCSLISSTTNPTGDIKITLSFTAAAGVDPGVTITSNEAIITFPKELGTVTASIDNGSIIKNKVDMQSKATPIISGDAVAVALQSSSSYGTTTASKMTLVYGAQTTTADFSVMTKAAPSGSVGAPFSYVYKKYTSTDVGSISSGYFGIALDDAKIYWAHGASAIHQINIADLSVSPLTGFVPTHSGLSSYNKVAKHNSTVYATSGNILEVTGNTMYEIGNSSTFQMNVWNMMTSFGTPVSTATSPTLITSVEYVNGNYYMSAPTFQQIIIYSPSLTILGVIPNAISYQMTSIDNILYVYFMDHIDEYDVSTAPVPTSYRHREMIVCDNYSQSATGRTLLSVPGTSYLFSFGDRSKGRIIEAIDTSTYPYTIKNQVELYIFSPGVADHIYFDIAIGADHKAYMMNVGGELYVVDLSGLF